MWKKILSIIAVIGGFLLAVFLGRRTIRRGDNGVRSNLHEAGEHIERASGANSNAAGAIDDGKRTAGDIAELNRLAQADVKRAKQLLHDAIKRGKTHYGDVGGNYRGD